MTDDITDNPDFYLLHFKEDWSCLSKDGTEKCAIFKVWSETNRLIPRPILEMIIPTDVNLQVKKIIHPDFYMKRSYEEFGPVYFPRTFSPTEREKENEVAYLRNIILDNFTRKGQARFYIFKGNLSRSPHDIDLNLRFKVVP